MTKKSRPNEPCPCRSGRKFKKCCGGPAASRGATGLPHTEDERASATAQLDFFIDELWEEEEEEAFEAFWGRFLARESEVPEALRVMSRDVQETWFAFDYQPPEEPRIIDAFLEEAVLSAGERSFLVAMRQSTLRLYEVTDTVPGSSMTLRDLVEGAVVTVSERTASRSVARRECLVARVIARGCSGRPEMERGVLHVPALWRDHVLASVQKHRSDFLRDHPGQSIDGFYKLLAPLFHEAWLRSLFEPAVPRLANTDGEEVVVTRVSFQVIDEGSLVSALDGAERDGLTRSGDAAWSWSGPSASHAQVSLAILELRGDILTAEANSVARGARTHELITRLAGTAIRHRATTHEDMQRAVTERVTAHALGKGGAAEDSAPGALDPDVAEAVVAQYYASHYRAWVDEPVPTLDGRTPREAARTSERRARVEDLIRGLEGLYERALKDGQPAYDPSWMWADLGLEAEGDSSPLPPLAHERVAARVPGSADASLAAAARFRAAPSFSDTSTIVEDDELQRDLALQRFLRRERASGNDAGQEGALAAPYLPLMVNLDLHRRKVFWVDSALSYMLENTDVDVAGRELRTPFPSFALVFTDRHALSLAERLLSRRADDPLRGQILRVATAYVTERHRADGRSLAVVFALDALGADLPSLIRYEVPADDDASVRAILDAVAPRLALVPEVRDTSPARGLLRLVLNAILYATSAGVTPEVRTVAPRQPSKGHSAAPSDSDSVFFLPGKIDIRSVRKLQELERAPEGRALLARFMVRGHWRRPSKNWSDLRLRWIEPYWKGPDMAAVIEKAYRLKP